MAMLFLYFTFLVNHLDFLIVRHSTALIHVVAGFMFADHAARPELLENYTSRNTRLDMYVRFQKAKHK